LLCVVVLVDFLFLTKKNKKKKKKKNNNNNNHNNTDNNKQNVTQTVSSKTLVAFDDRSNGWSSGVIREIQQYLRIFA
jgi:hypothetical protein